MSHKKYRTEKNCLNCGEWVERKFCPECGQENVQVRESFLHIVSHFISDYLHYDSKFFKSLGYLLTKPGFLTKEYLEGRRMRYIHPLRLFFFATIVMVIVANAYHSKFKVVVPGHKAAIVQDSVVQPTIVSRYDLHALNSQEQKIIENLSEAFDNMSHYLKYISFLLLPVYALGFYMLYWRTKKFYVDQLVYTVHVQSFGYVILIMLLPIFMYLIPSFHEWYQAILVLVIALYLTLSLKYLYRQSWARTLFKVALAIIYIVVVTYVTMAGFILLSFMKAG